MNNKTAEIALIAAAAAFAFVGIATLIMVILALDIFL
jgi:hypothetical protein